METNRITNAVRSLTERISTITDVAALDRMEDAATLDSGDWLLLGDKPTRGMIAGHLSLVEAQSLHNIHTRFNTATLAERLTFIMAVKELMEKGV